MRTARLLTVSRSARGRGGGGGASGVYPGGCLPRRVSTQEGVYLGEGCLHRRCLPSGMSSQGAPRVVSAVSATPRREANHPQLPAPPVNRITDRCKNITFPQLRLRAVKFNHCKPLVWRNIFWLSITCFFQCWVAVYEILCFLRSSTWERNCPHIGHSFTKSKEIVNLVNRQFIS